MYRSNQNLNELKERISKLLETDQALTIKDLCINGADLQNEGDIPASREMGQVLDYLLETVLDDPEMNIKDKLLKLARNYYKEVLLK
jgi:tRNA nucleotidyltransferase (CCA-adding enzyme)